MNTEEHDDLWRLLGRAKSPDASPFFSRNVLRAIREEGQERPGFFVWLRQHWRVAAISTCAVVISAGLVLVREEQSSDPDLLLAQQVSVSPDYQVISNLDELLDSEHNSVWLEASIN